MSQTLQPPPYAVPIADSSGRSSQAWAQFFKILYSRVGAAVALSNTELAQLHDESVTVLQEDVTALTTQVDTLTSTVNTGFSDLGQGREL
jgi:hypothetical protein